MIPTLGRTAPAEAAPAPTTEQPCAVEAVANESFLEILQAEIEPTDELPLGPEVVPMQQALPLEAAPPLDGEPEGDPVAKVEARALDAPVSEVALQELDAAVDTQVVLPAEAKAEPKTEVAVEKAAPAVQVERTAEAALESAFEEPLRVEHMTAESAELVLGEGEDRLALTVSTEGQRVHVSARTPSVQMVDALARASGDLRQALEQQGYELGGFDARRDRSADHGEQREPTHAERQRLVVKKKRIVA